MQDSMFIRLDVHKATITVAGALGKRGVDVNRFPTAPIPSASWPRWGMGAWWWHRP